MPPFYHVVELSSWMRIMAKCSTISRMVRQLDLGDPRTAIPYWHRAIAAGENSAVTMAHLADGYSLSGRRAEALHWQGLLLDYHSDSPQACQIRAMLRSQRERL